jgi:hypothetical protein
VEIFVLVGIIFSIICGVMASNKGRSVAGWAVCGFLLGLVATLILVVAPSLQPKEALARS